MGNGKGQLSEVTQEQPGTYPGQAKFKSNLPQGPAGIELVYGIWKQRMIYRNEIIEFKAYHFLPFPRGYGNNTIRFFIRLSAWGWVSSFWRPWMLFHYCEFISSAFTWDAIWLRVVWCWGISHWEAKNRSDAWWAHIQNSVCIPNLLKVSIIKF